VHASLDFFHGSVRWGECSRGGAVGGDLEFKGGDFFFGEKTIFFEADFTAAFVAVPEDEKED